jgi:hypothetical protein
LAAGRAKKFFSKKRRLSICVMKTYQIGDYVRIKDGAPLVGTDEKPTIWQGKILHEGTNKELVLIELDAFTLEILSDYGRRL